MTSNVTTKATKPRYIAWMESISCTTFINKVESLSQGSTKPAVAVFMIFWRDGFDPNTSMKRNRHTVWVLTVTFFFFDLTKKKLYLVESCLVAMGPGKEDHKGGVTNLFGNSHHSSTLIASHCYDIFYCIT